jgi:hypothetical protein
MRNLSESVYQVTTTETRWNLHTSECTVLLFPAWLIHRKLFHRFRAGECLALGAVVVCLLGGVQQHHWLEHVPKLFVQGLEPVIWQKNLTKVSVYIHHRNIWELQYVHHWGEDMLDQCSLALDKLSSKSAWKRFFYQCRLKIFFSQSIGKRFFW